MEEINSEEVWYTHTLSKWKRAIIDVKDVMALLKYRDVRSVLNWCKEHDVFVLNQGNTQVVNQAEFILAFYKPFLKHLKRTKENWKELFMDYVCGNVSGILSVKRDKPISNHYSPKTKLETSFLKKMKNL
jgi:hypothetical protein